MELATIVVLVWFLIVLPKNLCKCNEDVAESLELFETFAIHPHLCESLSFIVTTDHDCSPQFVFDKFGCVASLSVQDVVYLYTSPNRDNTMKIKNLISYTSKCGQKWWKDVCERLKETGISVAVHGETTTRISQAFDNKDALISEVSLRLSLYFANQGKGPRIYEQKESHKSTEALQAKLSYDPFEIGTVWSELLKYELCTWNLFFSISI